MKNFQFVFKTSLLVLLITICSAGFGQDNNSKKMNLPPGSKMKSKPEEFIDYSYKLSLIGSVSPQNSVTENFLADISNEEMEEIKLGSSEKYDYYMKANTYYTNLSNKVKSVYSVKELWYIYVYDVELSNKLIAIK